MSSPDKIVANLTNTHTKRQLLYEMSARQFFKLEYPITSKRSNEDWFVFKLRQIQSTKTRISIDKECVDLFYGKLYTLKEEENNVGFLVNMPCMPHTIQHDILVSSPKNTKVENLKDSTKLFLASNTFSVFVLDDTVQYISAYDRDVIAKFT